MQKRGFSEAACGRLLAQIFAYVLGRAPFGLPCPPNMEIVDWWASLPDDKAGELKSLATFLYSFCPHAADPERFFSTLGFYKGQRRSGLGVDTLCMMATVKTFYDNQQPRCACLYLLSCLLYLCRAHDCLACTPWCLLL